MEVSEFMEIHEFSFADRKLQSGPITRQINIQHNLIPTQEPKETIDLVCTEINGKTPRAGLPRRGRGSRTPELLHTQPCQHPKGFGTSGAALGLSTPGQVWFALLKALWPSRGGMCSPPPGLQSPSQGRCFPPRLSPGRSNVGSSRPYFSFLFQMHWFFYLLDSEEELWPLFCIPGLPQELE